MGTAQESRHTQSKYIVSSEWFNNLKVQNIIEESYNICSCEKPHKNVLIIKTYTFVFCITRNWGSTETASRYTQNAQKILFTKWWEVDGWINKANAAQGSTCIQIKKTRILLLEEKKKKKTNVVFQKSASS